MPELKILIIDDDASIGEQVFDLLNGTEVAGARLTVDRETDFEVGRQCLVDGNYDIVILDVYRGNPSEENHDLVGREILEGIKATVPIVVIFYTGITTHVEELKSEVVKIASKVAAGELQRELESLITTGTALTRQKLSKHVVETLREYFWEFVDKNGDLIHSAGNEALQEYLLLRRLASTLTRGGMNRIFGKAISTEKVHPLEFYICPPIETTLFETGDILKKDSDGSFHVVLTPSCDFAQKSADFILLAAAHPLTENPVYKKYAQDVENKDNKDNLGRLIGSRKGDRFFFLPRNEFIKMPDLVIDFQDLSNHKFTGFTGYTKVAKIDDPFCQDMLASFVRNKNRPGSPDLDTDHVLKYLEDEIKKDKEKPEEKKG